MNDTVRALNFRLIDKDMKTSPQKVSTLACRPFLATHEGVDAVTWYHEDDQNHLYNS